jgi:hypothetical protein
MLLIQKLLCLSPSLSSFFIPHCPRVAFSLMGLIPGTLTAQELSPEPSSNRTSSWIGSKDGSNRLCLE